jgi:hypothetical protein
MVAMVAQELLLRYRDNYDTTPAAAEVEYIHYLTIVTLVQ